MRIIKTSIMVNGNIIIRYNDEYALLADNTAKEINLADLPNNIKWDSPKIFKLKGTNQGLIQVVELSKNMYLSNDGIILAEDNRGQFIILHRFTFVPPERS